MAGTEKVGIEIELMGGEEAYNLLKRIDGEITKLNNKKRFKSLSGLNSSKAELESYMSDLKKLNKEQEKWQKLANRVGKENMSAFGVREWDRIKQKISETQAKIKQMSADMDSVTQKTRTFGQVFKSVTSTVAHIGSAMQSLGNAMTRLTSPFRRLTSGLLMGAGYKALNLFSEGLNNVFTRSDTMKNYDRSLKALGLDTKQTFKVFKEAKTAKDNLDEAVQGLPTSLDEIMAAQKVYAGATGEMIESTKTAIAANNTFLASGMGAREQRFMQKYLVAMASGAELTTTQWQSMARIAPLAMRAVSKELGYADDEYAQFTKDVQKGTIAGKDFLKAFQKVGISGAVADAARVQTESWAGLSSNIRIAVTRAGQAAIDTLNETFKDATGRTLLQRLLGIDAKGKKMGDGIRDWINDISESVQNWIKANPDKIVDFFETLKSIDLKGFLKGVAEGAGQLAQILASFAKIASDKDLSKLGKRMVWMNALGGVFSTVGGFLKGTRHIWGFFGALAIKGVGKIGIFGKIASLFGKKKDIDQAANAGSAITTASPKMISAFKNVALLSGIVAMPAVTGFVVTAALKKSIENFKDMVAMLKDMDWSAAAKLAGGIAVFLGGSAGLGALVGKFGVTAGTFAIIGETIVGLLTGIATGFFALDMAFIKSGIKNFVESINLLKEIPDVNGMGDVTTKISNAIEVFNKVSTLLNGEWLGPGMHEGGIQSVGLGTVWSINSIAKALAPLKQAADSINELAAISIPPNAPTRIGAIIDAISEIQSQMWKLMGIGFGNIKGNITKIADSMLQMRRVVYHVNKLGSEKVNTSGIKSIKKAINQIGKAFDAEAIGSLRAKITGFVASIEDAFTELAKLNKDIEIKASVKLASSFQTSVNTVKQAIKNAKNDIQKLKAPISFNIPVSVTFSVTSNAWSAIAKIRDERAKVRQAREGAMQQTYEAKGGMIYRARGGGVPWRRRGTDTVPAMLTPGEYVHNKRAVNTFGIDFMRKVNNLDMKGAMTELMHRAGHMANINRGATITNNYNNNQKVVINNNNAGAGFTFKSASRFVGAF